MAPRSTRNPVPDEVIRHHVRRCLDRGLPELATVPQHGRTMAIAGAGPSLRLLPPEYGEEALPYDIFAVGGAHDWLIERGVVPHAWINADPLPLVANYLKNPHPDVRYYIASHSHPFVFDALDGYDVTVWHDEVGAGTDEVVRQYPRGHERIMVMGGCSGAMRAPWLGHELGYRRFVFYGVDGSGGYEAARAKEDRRGVVIEVGGREYVSNLAFAHQAVTLEKLIEFAPDWEIHVRGDGLMAAVADAKRSRP